MDKFFLMIICFIWCFQSIQALQQTCTFDGPNYYINSVDGPTKTYWRCYFNHIKLLVENELVTTSNAGNSKQMTDVNLLLYNSGNVIKFIPYSIFVSFPNIEFLEFRAGQGLEVLKPDFFKNATKLITLWIRDNLIAKLDANIFKEVPTLEHINLNENKIEKIHRAAFDGLPKLQNIYLVSNKLTNLHPNTFTHLLNLKTLNLLTNSCINKKFSNASNENSEIITEIGKTCKFNMTTVADVVDVLVMKEYQSDKIHQTLNTKISKLDKDYIGLKAHQDHLEKEEEKASKYSSIYTKYIKNMIDAMNNKD